MSDQDGMAMHDQPPKGNPPILLDIDYAGEAARSLSAPASIEDGQLVLHGGGPGTIAGHPFSDDSYRDVIIDTRIGIIAGDGADLVGVFLRQSAPRTYVVAAFSPAGRVYVATVDGDGHPVVEGTLDPVIPFMRGIGEFNRVTIVAFGPSLVVVVNGSVLAHLAVDAKYAAGSAGLFLQQGPTSTEPRAAARWVQVRAVLVDQS